jgi:hypothetical protein
MGGGEFDDYYTSDRKFLNNIFFSTQHTTPSISILILILIF